jgi:glucose-6-phosphate 1-dehydrogenase
VIGVGFREWTDDALRQQAREGIEGAGERIDESVFRGLAGRLSYVRGDFRDAALYRPLRA